MEKVGPKTAAALTRQFGDLETLLKHAFQIQKASVRAAVQASGERVCKNHRLIFLEGSRDLPFAPEELVYVDRGLTTTQVLRLIGLR